MFLNKNETTEPGADKFDWLGMLGLVYIEVMFLVEHYTSRGSMFESCKRTYRKLELHLGVAVLDWTSQIDQEASGPSTAIINGECSMRCLHYSDKDLVVNTFQKELIHAELKIALCHCFFFLLIFLR